MVERGVEEHRVAAHRVPQRADTSSVDIAARSDDRQCGGRVGEHLAHQQLAAQQPVGHRVVVLKPIVSADGGAAGAHATIFKAQLVSSKDRHASRGEGGPKGLERIARSPPELAPAQVPFAVVLVIGDNGGKRTGALRTQEECADNIAVSAR